MYIQSDNHNLIYIGFYLFDSRQLTLELSTHEPQIHGQQTCNIIISRRTRKHLPINLHLRPSPLHPFLGPHPLINLIKMSKAISLNLPVPPTNIDNPTKLASRIFQKYFDLI